MKLIAWILVLLLGLTVALAVPVMTSRTHAARDCANELLTVKGLHGEELDIRAAGRGHDEGGEVNALPGVVRRHIYLGDSRDYLLAVDGSSVTLRALVPPWMRHAVGDRVVLGIAPNACHLLAES